MNKFKSVFNQFKKYIFAVICLLLIISGYFYLSNRNTPEKAITNYYQQLERTNDQSLEFLFNNSSFEMFEAYKACNYIYGFLPAFQVDKLNTWLKEMGDNEQQFTKINLDKTEDINYLEELVKSFGSENVVEINALPVNSVMAIENNELQVIKNSENWKLYYEKLIKTNQFNSFPISYFCQRGELKQIENLDLVVVIKVTNSQLFADKLLFNDIQGFLVDESTNKKIYLVTRQNYHNSKLDAILDLVEITSERNIFGLKKWQLKILETNKFYTPGLEEETSRLFAQERTKYLNRYRERYSQNIE
ncbi:MAG: hypothetical protein WCJ58_01930 [bacterium]